MALSDQYMRIYVGFDDTDTKDSDRGTGRLARLFADALPEGCRLWGVVRQQLPRLPGIPYTSNNSSACVVVETRDLSHRDMLIEQGIAHLKKLYIPGSDPGLCVATERDADLEDLISFGRVCCTKKVTQHMAMSAAKHVHLSGHGGSNDGIIGAAAGVGLTLFGWSGRLVQFGTIRDLPEQVAVHVLENQGIRVLPMERDALLPAMTHLVHTHGWLRPRLWGFQPVLPVERISETEWQVVGLKQQGAHGGGRNRRREA